MGIASNTTPNTTVGGRFESDSSNGVGVQGLAPLGNGFTFGGHFTAMSNSGTGVYGSAPAFGGHFESNGGQAVYAVENSTTGTTYGVYSIDNSLNGYAMYALGGGTGVYGTGVIYGLSGQATSVNGFGGFFKNTNAGGKALVAVTNTGGEALTVRSNGDVGISAPSPLASLTLGKLGKYDWTILNGWGDFSLTDGNVGFSVGVATGGGGTGDVRLWAKGGLQRLMFGNPTNGDTLAVYNGNVGIGTISPIAKLDVRGGWLKIAGTFPNACDANSEGAIAFFVGNNGSPFDHLAACGRKTDGSYEAKTLACWWDNCSIASIPPFSDVRLKKNIFPIAPTLNRLAQLQPVSFEFRSGEFPELHLETGRKSGLIAQDVEKVLPELVVTVPQGFKTVKYDELPMLMLQAIRELDAQNQSLRQQLQKQEERLRRLEAALQSSAGPSK
ncbi:MAG: tail fiber domain-containing protein [Acidobacteria bacterium]|nr:tail fiber domain-containing protein [Acidobacteriota bacterium]